MSIELSPSQERRLHSILDRGLDTLQETVANISRCTPIKPGQLVNSNQDSSPKSSDCSDQTEKSKVINIELKNLQAKLATLEAKLVNNFESKPPISRPKSPNGCFKKKKKIGDLSPKGSLTISKRRNSKDRVKSIESSVKALTKLDKSITPSPARQRSSVKPRESLRNLTKNRIKSSEMNKKDPDDKDLKESLQQLQQDYEKLQQAYKRSEKIRKKQNDLIAKLKKDLKKIN